MCAMKAVVCNKKGQPDRLVYCDVDKPVPGDEVMGDLAGYGFGGLAEYVAAPGTLLVRKPSGISFDEAAAIPMAGVTAL